MRGVGQGDAGDAGVDVGDVVGVAGVADDIPDIDPEEDMMEMAEDLIEKKMGEFDPDDFEDSYETALRDLIEQKAEEEEIVSPVGEEGEEKTGEVVDLMEALKKSLEQEGGKKKAS